MLNYRIGLYEKAMPNHLRWDEKLVAAKAAGYDFVEMSIDATEDKIRRVYSTEEQKRYVLKKTLDIGIPVRSLCVSALTKYAIGDPDDAISERGVDIALHSIEMAEYLGVRIIMLPGYDIYYGNSTLESKQKFSRNIKKIAEAAQAAGVIIAFETMENEFMNTVEKAMKYVNLTGYNFLQVYPDLGNITNAAVLHQHDVLEDLELGRGSMVAMHLKETKPGVFREVPYGQGHVNFEAGVKKAWDLGIRRFVTEFWYDGSEDWENTLKEVCLKFRKLIEEVADS